LIIEFDYNGRWNAETTHRRIAPYQILMDDGMCFLFGYDLNKDAERMFYLNRMKNLTVSSTQWLKVKEWILAQGANAIPRSPKWFVENWKNTVLAMLENVKVNIKK